MPKIKLSAPQTISEAAMATFDTGDPEKKPKKVKVDRDIISDEMKVLYNRPLKYDNNRPANEVVVSAATKGGVDPSFLFSSSFQEGMNQAIAHPDDVSEAYEIANSKGALKDFKIDGFYGYGLDTFGQKLGKLNKYLPAGFDQRYKIYDAKNEKGESIKTAAFRTNEDALIAKSAMLRDIQDTVNNMAAKRGIKLDDKAKNYFTLAAYNGGEGNARMMLDEYVQAKDKNDFIDNGRTTRQGVHKNVSPRLKRMQMVSELLTPKQQAALSAQATAQ